MKRRTATRQRSNRAALIALALFFFASPAWSDGVTAADAAFLQAAARANAAEVKISQAAQTRATSEQVKAFADRMVDDHSSSNHKLEALAKKKNIAVTAELDTAHLMKIGELQKLQGGAFDHAYVASMIEDHRAAEQLFERAARDAGDADIRRFAENTLPVLREHTTMAQSLSH
jgi:putative membrane protein